MNDSACKPRRILSEEAKRRKKEFDRGRGKTRVNIGEAFNRWREIKEETECKTDAELAWLLLDFFQKQQMNSAPSSRRSESLPEGVTEESGDEEIHRKATHPGLKDIEEFGGEVSMYSFSNTEEEQEDSADEDEVISARRTKSTSGLCSVDGCDSGSRSVQQFQLPEDPERRLEWVMFLAKANKQCFKESSWTDITVCSEHFTEDCLLNVNGIIQLRASAVPSLCRNSGPEDLVESLKHEPEDNLEVGDQHEELSTHHGPNSCSEDSRQTSSGVPSRASCSADSSLGDQIQPKRLNDDLINEKAALLKKGKFPVNEKRLLQLFRRNCPSCGSKILMYKVTRGLLISMHQLCQKCDYTYQWKSQVNWNVPGADGGPEAGYSEGTPADMASSSGAGGYEVSLDDEDSDFMEESSDPGDMDSDEDWSPTRTVLPKKMTHDSNDDDDGDDDDDEEECSEDYYPALTSQFSQLCTDCGKFFDRRRSHICEHKLKPFSCNICGIRCINKHALTIHSRIHSENYQFCCKYCHAAFKFKADKVTHEKIHMTEETPYKCPECSETFATNQERRMHLDDHRGPNASYCDICNVKFRSQKDFERHELVHTGEKPFKCLVCERGFTQAGNLKSHMRLHTGERPYKCQHCGKCFNHNVSLKSHVQRYHAGSSGPEQTSHADGAQRNEGMGGADFMFDRLAEEKDSNEWTNMGFKYKPKSRRSTGRPIGRPKRSASDKVVKDDEVESQISNTGTGKSPVKGRKRKRCTEEDGEPPDGNESADSEEENGEQPKDLSEHSGIDSDFDPAETRRKMKKRCRSQNIGRGKRGGRGRPRKNLVT